MTTHDSTHGSEMDRGARKTVSTAQHAAERAGEYVHSQVARLSDRAQDLGREARDRVADYTGKPIEAWTADLREMIRTRPLQVLALTIGVGYVLGKLMRRG